MPKEGGVEKVGSGKNATGLHELGPRLDRLRVSHRKFQLLVGEMRDGLDAVGQVGPEGSDIGRAGKAAAIPTMATPSVFGGVSELAMVGLRAGGGALFGERLFEPARALLRRIDGRRVRGAGSKMFGSVAMVGY